mmetsp:Transcript_13873/g.39477  ORF Transcript_13873/g.39477 Transcript_13873/m.39477 type:complete len:267 (-) Transcript_13873:51-851(-)
MRRGRGGAGVGGGRRLGPGAAGEAGPVRAGRAQPAEPGAHGLRGRLGRGGRRDGQHRGAGLLPAVDDGAAGLRRAAGGARLRGRRHPGEQPHHRGHQPAAGAGGARRAPGHGRLCHPQHRHLLRHPHAARGAGEEGPGQHLELAHERGHHRRPGERQLGDGQRAARLLLQRPRGRRRRRPVPQGPGDCGPRRSGRQQEPQGQAAAAGPGALRRGAARVPRGPQGHGDDRGAAVPPAAGAVRGEVPAEARPGNDGPSSQLRAQEHNP